MLGAVNRLVAAPGSCIFQVQPESKCKRFCKSEQAYTLHKPARCQFTRNHTYVAEINAQWQADLAELQGIARQNDGMRYLITVIDVLSNFAWAVPVISKNAKAITVAFRHVLTAAKPRHSGRLHTDKGKEFSTWIFRPWWSAIVSSTLPLRAS